MSFINYVLGPKLFMEYNSGNQKMYEAGGLEKFADQILGALSLIWNLGYYTSPFLMTFLYRKGYLVTDSIASLAKFSASIGIIVTLSLCMRGIGRSQTKSYTKLVKALDLAKSTNSSEEGKRQLSLFDFDFRSWPVDFDVKSVEGDCSKKLNDYNRLRDGRSNFKFVSLPCHIAAYVAMHTFGIRIIYPGSIRMLQKYMRPMFVSGRAKLIEEENAKRYKLKTKDGNEIDTMYVNRRGKTSNGKTLVICSEGNAGFYEIGIMGTPLALKYSVLGWNHPGFEGSSGTPYPDQDKNAIDAVMQFAIHHLGYAVEDIILYGWSIGGYSSLVAASAYPEVKGIILDATFDDVLHLAVTRMPKSLVGIVKIAIRNYCNLNNVEMIPNYNGPVLLIRRTEDEVIAEDNRIESNRGNFLVLAFLKYRYPNIFKTHQIDRAMNQLSKPIEKRNKLIDEDVCISRLITYASDQGKSFPMLIGEDYSEDTRNTMADYLLRKHFIDYKSTHCTPLPVEYFNIPWDIPIEQRFVFT